MSVAASVPSRTLPRDSITPTREPLAVRVLEWSVAMPVVGVFIVLSALHWHDFINDALTLCVLVVLVLILHLVPVTHPFTVQLTMSLPVLLGAGMVLSPVETGAAALIASTDPREFRREVSLGHAVFNRAQIALASAAASLAFHSVGGSSRTWPLILAPAMLALVVDTVINTTLVGAALVLATGVTIRKVLAHVLAGGPLVFVVSYLSFGLLAVPFAMAYRHDGIWGFAAVLMPIVVARQMFVFARNSAAASADAEVKARLLERQSRQIAEERREERTRVAASLHDEVLQALYKVDLLGQVVRRDLETGRLLELEDDVPDLVSSTTHAADTIRLLIRDLRQSSLGPGGLTTTLRLLIQDLNTSSEAQIESRLEEVGGSAMKQLLLYQIGREAVQNSVRHSGAQHIWVDLRMEAGQMRLVVRDDGRGFDPALVDSTAHFGLELMKERAGEAGGTLTIHSAPGAGTEITARCRQRDSY